MVGHEPTASSAGAARVILVDDSAIVRGLMRRWIDADGRLNIVGTASNGAEAIDLAKKMQPDLIILDLEMPVMDGVSALPHLLKALPQCKILVASTLSTRNAKISLEAIRLGAADYLAKPGVGSISKSDFERELMAKLHALAPKSTTRNKPISSGQQQSALSPSQPITGLTLVASTGGPLALSQLMPHLRAFRQQISVFVVQHMPAHFTPLLAKDLCALSHFDGGEAVHGQAISTGQLYVAPGDYHMRLASETTGLELHLDQSPPVHFCRPAADPFLTSFAKHYGPQGAVCVLTGMGSDGAAGALAVRQAGGWVFAQDQQSSAVWGMPGAAVANGSAHKIVGLAQLGHELEILLSQSAGQKAGRYA
ncbi:two-component system chemotaxis response regulator CheB [Maritalea mobilis]|uniref:Protein-glutamate methylesterase/protein-glutamine glutaminase n=1 Tax=Maritalea mobilis TaxID=483324 RepID=A0A4R6VWV1_9HYPH|nr:chemotaxis-specific protein-glutamate methyltransferase CheB [Maritalea mobilis]TDQ67317.1 two-component system chemotaxis response regulator CheB [Maritalea mobilis]